MEVMQMGRCRLCGKEEEAFLGPCCLLCDKIIVDNYYVSCITGAADD
jgi:hypothetical protein